MPNLAETAHQLEETQEKEEAIRKALTEEASSSAGLTTVAGQGKLDLAQHAITDQKILTEQSYCSLMIKGGICLEETNTLITRTQVQAGLIASFDFSTKINVNSAGGKQTLQGSPLVAGPSPDGEGASAVYNGSNYNYVLNTNDWLTKDREFNFTYTFWVYLYSYNESDSTSGLCCPITQKGISNSL
jgi:hypothetical protein